MYTWKAVYSDGRSLAEFDENGEHGTGQIDKTCIESILLIPDSKELPTHRIEIHPPEERLIAIARRVIEIGTEEKWTIFVVGWQKTLEGKNHKTLLFCYPDGSVRLSSEDL